MALIWQNPNTDPAYYKCYALKHLQPRLQPWCPMHLFFPVSFFQRHRESISQAQIHEARTISISKEKRRDVEFISMVPITAAEERARQMMWMQRDVCAWEVEHREWVFIFFAILIFVLLRNLKQFRHHVYMFTSN